MNGANPSTRLHDVVRTAVNVPLARSTSIHSSCTLLITNKQTNKQTKKTDLNYCEENHHFALRNSANKSTFAYM